MSEMKLGRNILCLRRERGITQDELAEYLGVSKSAVSKWETGNSYPDILLLPQLASLFNISVDQLIGYEPQLTRWHRMPNSLPRPTSYWETRTGPRKYS